MDKTPTISLFLDDMKVWRILTDQQLGQLMHAIELYFNDGVEPEFEDPLVSYAYETHKTTIQRYKAK